MSVAGISMLRGRYQAIKVLKEIDGEAEETDDLKWAAREKELAQQEVDNDFPLLHETGDRLPLELSGGSGSLVRRKLAWQQAGNVAQQGDHEASSSPRRL